MEGAVGAIFREKWTTREGRGVPEPKDLGLANDGVYLNATVLYADLSDSTVLVDTVPAQVAAEIYKAFLVCAARLIVSEGGVITAYDGDRVMAVFVGEFKDTTAARTALRINWATKNIVQTGYNNVYGSVYPYTIHHVVGVDTSKVLVARAGFRGANDLVWIGRAANYAAKLCALNHDYATWITKDVYDRLADASKLADQVNMWKLWQWTQMNNAPIYSSTYWWAL